MLFGRGPLVRGWLHAAISLWNRIQQLPDEHLLRSLLSEGLALGGGMEAAWLSDMLSCGVQHRVPSPEAIPMSEAGQG